MQLALPAAHHLDPKVKLPTFMHVTSLMAFSGFLWIGTSVGLILIYRIPHLEGIPIVSSKPYLAMDAHKGAVRVLLPVRTKATIFNSRVEQFLNDEQARSKVVAHPDDDEEEEDTSKEPATLLEEDEDGEDVVPGILENCEEGAGDDGTLKREQASAVVDEDTPQTVDEEKEVERKDIYKTLSPLSSPSADVNGVSKKQVCEGEHELVKPAEPDSEPKEDNDSREDNEVGVQAGVEGEEKTNGTSEDVEKVDGADEDKLDEPLYEFGEDSEEIFGAVNRDGGASPPANGNPETDVYSNPIELDLVPSRKQQATDKDEGIYDIPREILPPEVLNRLPANYEAPAPLNDQGEAGLSLLVV